jgi:hypothetical protein
VTATTAVATGPASSAVASSILREILMDLGLEPVLGAVAAAAFLWGELMDKALAPAAAPPPTGEVVSPANHANSTSNRGCRCCAGRGHSSVISGGRLGAAPDRRAGGGERAPPPLEPFLVRLLRFLLFPAMVKRDNVI